MATVLTRCLYILILLCHLRVPHVTVDNALLDLKPFSGPEHTVLQDWGTGNVSEYAFAVEDRDAEPLPSFPPQTLEPRRISEDAGLNRDFSFDADRPPAGKRPSPFHRALLLVRKHLETLPDTKTPDQEVENERRHYVRKLLAEERKIQKLQERVEALERDGAALEGQRLQLKAQVEAGEQRLQVLDQLCREKDSSLQQKLIQEQVDRQEMDTVLNTYKLRIQEIRQEKQRSEHCYRGQIDYVQRRAYENSMKVCALEQALEQERSEAERLRQLLAISVRLAQFQLSMDTSTGSDHLSLIPETGETDVSMVHSQPSPTDSLFPDLATPLRPTAVNTSLIGQTRALATPANRSLPTNLGLHI
ncbi:transport and Golgi organization protein 1 homolog isoform X2 [Anguilla rostrata]|uniref:transport and Golgi organization protein 1 homolog isoform X2 n=1 Tax=Anguilla rostrata TaxID=7938 RepID=UPI0030D1030F